VLLDGTSPDYRSGIDAKRNHTIKARYILFITLIILILPLAACSTSSSESSNSASSGAVDLTQWDFSQKGMVWLDGQWEFYWDKLLTYDDLKQTSPDIYAAVPGTWDGYTINGSKLPGTGYATYRLHVKTAFPAGTRMGLWVNNFSSSYNLYVNEDLVSSNGHVADNEEHETGEYRSQAVIFSLPGNEFDILIQVSNFHYAVGGFWCKLVLGESQGIKNYSILKTFNPAFLLGALMLAFIYNIFLFFLRKEFKVNLYFGLFCLCTAFIFDSLNMNFLSTLLPGLSFESNILIWYSAGLWSMFFLALFMCEIFKSKLSSIVIKVLLPVTLGIQVLYLCISPVLYTRYIEIGSMGIALTNIFFFSELILVFLIIANGIKHGSREGWLHLISVFVLVLALFYDSIYYINILNNELGDIISYGLYVFLVIQMFIQARKNKEYHEAKTNAELKFLQAQIRPHFLYNSLSVIASLSTRDPQKSRSLIVSLSEYLRNTFDFGNFDDLIPLSKELELVKAYIEIEEARFRDRLDFKIICDEIPEMRIPRLVVQPLVENAIRHGILKNAVGGKVRLKIRKENTSMWFEISDDGAGMPAEVLKSIKENQTQGVGVKNIDLRLKKYYGAGLEISSNPGEGTTVRFRIPWKPAGRLAGRRKVKCDKSDRS
jgi:two-component system, LytTR family, sensor kinase